MNIVKVTIFIEHCFFIAKNMRNLSQSLPDYYFLPFVSYFDNVNTRVGNLYRFAT